MAETTTAPASFLTNPLMLEATAAALELHGEQAALTATGELLPATVRTWLARARLLEGVPFQHLVADAELLPPESIRFFFVDREWTDALIQGALSVGTVNTLDRAQLQELHAAIRDEVDTEERRVRMVGGENVGIAPANAISGFVLRSRAVSGWPALHVRAYREEVGPDDSMQIPLNDPRRMRLLRLERLAPAVLLCLFDGVPALVHIEEPRQGVQYGVDLGVGGMEIHLRDAVNTLFIDQLFTKPPPPHRIKVPFRHGGEPGVINVMHLYQRMRDVPATKISTMFAPGAHSALFAMQMLQFPFRQVFGEVGALSAMDVEPADADAFRPTIALDEVRAWEEES
jgi:hypothetical protein